MIHGLSHREYEVAELIAFGLTEKEIAFHMEISTNTVKSYKKGIYNKTGCRNIADVSRWYIQKVHGISIQPAESIRKLISLFMFFLVLIAEFSYTDFTRLRTRARLKTGRTISASRAKNKNALYLQFA